MNEKIKEILGDCYIDINDKNVTKDDIRKIINKFINKDNFSPIINTENKIKGRKSFSIREISYEIMDFANDNGYQIVNPRYVFNKIDPNLKRMTYNNQFLNDIHMLECDGVKKIFVKRSSRNCFNEIDNANLKKGTLINIYLCSVYNIVNYKLFNRRLKESLNNLKKLNNEIYVRMEYDYYDSQSILKSFSVNKIKINDINLDRLDISITLDVKSYDIHNHTSHAYSLIKKLNNTNSIDEYYNDMSKNIITTDKKKEIIDNIKKQISSQIDLYNNDINMVESFIC